MKPKPIRDCDLDPIQLDDPGRISSETRFDGGRFVFEAGMVTVYTLCVVVYALWQVYR